MAVNRLFIATHNRKKAGEMETILGERLSGLELLTLADFPGAPEPDETGATYRENAAIKAASAAVYTDLPSLADDAGLEIDALGGAPGLYSKRFGGEKLPFPEKMARVLELLKDKPDEQRTARFRCVIAFVQPHQESAFQPRFFEATCEGRIAQEPSGSGGFGYDPIFFLPEQGCTMADLTAEQKHQISHRGKVLRAFADWWPTHLQ
jgi:XTP/dITP diphosphohydrolase